VTDGIVTLDLTLAPAVHMFDGSGQSSSPGALPQATPTPASTSGGAIASAAVFGSGMVGVSNDIDPSPAPPADSAQSIIRHVIVRLQTRPGGPPIPYLAVTMDLLLDGHPVLYNQPLEPMTAVGSKPLQYYYGNNVDFPQRGIYEIFVRIQPSPLLGPNPPPAAQFNVVLH
jgi:hypothetical protein